MTDVIDTLLLERFRLEPSWPLERAISLMETNPLGLSVKEMADHTCVSRRHLNRLMRDHVGVSAKRLQQIFTFRHILNRKQTIRSEDSFTRLAYDASLADQSHLNKLFRSMANRAPRAFFKEGTSLGQEDTYWRLEKW